MRRLLRQRSVSWRHARPVRGRILQDFLVGLVGQIYVPKEAHEVRVQHLLYKVGFVGSRHVVIKSNQITRRGGRERRASRTVRVRIRGSEKKVFPRTPWRDDKGQENSAWIRGWNGGNVTWRARYRFALCMYIYRGARIDHCNKQQTECGGCGLVGKLSRCVGEATLKRTQRTMLGGNNIA